MAMVITEPKKQTISFTQRVSFTYPQEARMGLKQHMRSVVGARVLELLEDGRDYLVYLEWQEAKPSPEQPLLGVDYIEFRLDALVLLRDIMQAEVGECIEAKPGDPVDCAIIVMQEPSGNYREYQRTELRYQNPKAPEYCWRRIK